MPKNVSEKQLAANRRNAQKSTGPKTPRGKAHSARNAIKHGLLASQIVVHAADNPERPEEFHALLDALRKELAPRNAVDHALVERIAACFWRLRRAHRYEAGALLQSLDQAQNDDPARKQIAQLEQQLKNARAIRTQRVTDFQYLQSLNLDDSQSLHDAQPMIEQLQTRYSRAVWKRPPRQTCEILLRELPAMIREYDEQEIPAIEHDLEQARENYRLRRERRALTASLPAPEEVLKLVRYENMLDRQLHRALAQLQRRRNEPKRTHPVSTAAAPQTIEKQGHAHSDPTAAPTKTAKKRYQTNPSTRDRFPPAV